VGQTKGRIIDRYKEHDRHLRKVQPSKSAIAAHFLEESHPIGPCKLLKEVRKEMHLDAWESLFIEKRKQLVNLDDPPISSKLLSLSENF
jgi:hypothetical protein